MIVALISTGIVFIGYTIVRVVCSYQYKAKLSDWQQTLSEPQPTLGSGFMTVAITNYPNMLISYRDHGSSADN